MAKRVAELPLLPEMAYGQPPGEYDLFSSHLAPPGDGRSWWNRGTFLFYREGRAQVAKALYR
jgi:hypothetical protein